MPDEQQQTDDALVVTDEPTAWEQAAGVVADIKQGIEDTLELLDDFGVTGGGQAPPSSGGAPSASNADADDLLDATIAPRFAPGIGLFGGAPVAPGVLGDDDVEEDLGFWARAKQFSQRKVVGGLSVGEAAGGVLGAAALGSLAWARWGR